MKTFNIVVAFFVVVALMLDTVCRTEYQKQFTSQAPFSSTVLVFKNSKKHEHTEHDRAELKAGIYYITEVGRVDVSPVWLSLDFPAMTKSHCNILKFCSTMRKKKKKSYGIVCLF